jgi:hypothetical protein
MEEVESSLHLLPFVDGLKEGRREPISAPLHFVFKSRCEKKSTDQRHLLVTIFWLFVGKRRYDKQHN